MPHYRRLLMTGTLLLVSGVCSAQELIYFSDRNEIKSNYWDNVSAWRAGSGSLLGRLPIETDSIALNTPYLSPLDPLTISEGVDAVCSSLQLASFYGSNNYETDGRIPSVRITGGTLTACRPTEDGKPSGGLFVGKEKGCYGLFLGDGGAVTTAYLEVGTKGIGVLTNRASKIVCKANLAVGQLGGTGLLSQVGGELSYSNGLFIGYAGDAYGEMMISNTAVQYSGSIVIGNGGTGKLILEAGSQLHLGPYTSFSIGDGAKGKGTLIYRGGDFSSRNIFLGNQGVGAFLISNQLVTPSPDIYVGIGDKGEGYLEIGENASLIQSTPGNNSLLIGYTGKGRCEQYGPSSCQYLKVGGSLRHWSVLTIYEGATNQILDSLQVGGYPMPPNWFYAERMEHSGLGEVRLKGGCLHLFQKLDMSLPPQPNVKIGRYENSFGRIAGWGKMIPRTPRETNARIEFYRGEFRADGEGVMRDLDLTEVVNVTNTVPNPPEGTNGWYAVRKGRVLYPRSWFSSNDRVTRCFGDHPLSPIPRLVNAVQLSFTDVPQVNNMVQGGLYALDREDIPAGLPENTEILGVWRLGLFSDVVDRTKKVGYGSVRPTFRYDHTLLKRGRTLSLFRHDGTKWVKVQAHEDAENRLLYADEDLPYLTGNTFNIGFFAVLSRACGTALIIN